MADRTKQRKMPAFKIGDHALNIVEFWSILTTLSAITGISFLYGSFDQFGPSLLFIFGFEDILLATIFAMAFIAVFALVLWFLLMLFTEMATLIGRGPPSSYSWWVAAPAFLIISCLAGLTSAHMTAASKGQVNLMTTSAVALSFGFGLLMLFWALRGFAGHGIASRSRSLRAGIALIGGYFTLWAAPNELGFTYIIYLWNAESQITSGTISYHDDSKVEQFGSLPCHYRTQVLWISSKVTIMRCNNDFVGQLNANGDKFWLGRFDKIGDQ